MTVSKGEMPKDFNKTFNTFYVDCGKIDFGTLTVRTRRIGDALRLTAHGGNRSLKRLMIDRHIPREARDLLAVIADKNGVIAVQSLGMSIEYRPQAAQVLEIQFEGITI